ncbi:MAG TPA: hypothetical protein VFB38_05465 [Chthonomonadaceae bacterium]|jgi:hypothetical protein|nr:hypothetical protein [Chthonomonadaceae bacterium]
MVIHLKRFSDLQIGFIRRLSKLCCNQLPPLFPRQVPTVEVEIADVQPMLCFSTQEKGPVAKTNYRAFVLYGSVCFSAAPFLALPFFCVGTSVACSAFGLPRRTQSAVTSQNVLTPGKQA